MIILSTHIVPEGVEEIRFSDYALKVIAAIPSRQGIKKAIKRGELLIDGKPAETGRWMIPGQQIDYIDLETKAPKIYDLSLEVVYEDEYIAVINKPSGIDVSGNKFRTIYNALAENIKKSGEADALKYPKPVHRLDSLTSGLLMIAKTASAHMLMGQQFERREIKKKYRAIVIGEIQEKGTFSDPINDMEALTEFSCVKTVPSLRNEWLSLVELSPHTGRTHQLRIHLANSGFPIMGDRLYGTEGEVLKGKGLFLCAVELSFNHPIDKRAMTVKIKEPYKFVSLLDREKRRWEKYN